MTLGVADPASDPAQRQARVVAAALRAAYAWSARDKYREAMREIARMSGVVMEAHGHALGPTGPMGLVRALRRPMAELLDFGDRVDEVLANAVLLDEHDRLADVAYDVACEYAGMVNHSFEVATWLPSWTRMRSEQIENEAFKALVESGDEAAYVRARRFLVDHPAGDKAQVSEALVNAHVPCPTQYRPLSADQRHGVDGDAWWWPCPVCRWPMAVTGGLVRCRYAPHHAVYQAVPGRSEKAPPRLQRIDEAGPARVPTARHAEAAVCVDAAVWRSIVVPGATEVRIADELVAKGARVSLWPGMDAYDVDVCAGTFAGRLDVKEYRSVRTLIDRLREKPPRGTLLLPKTHEHQRDVIREVLPALAVVTEMELHRKVRVGLRRLK